MIAMATTAKHSKPSDLSNRMVQIMEEQQMSQRAWGAKAGVSPSLVGQIVRGDLKGKSGPETFDKLARAANVSTQWLAEGKGPKGVYHAVPVIEPAASRADRYGNLAIVIEYWEKARPGRWSKGAIEAARSMNNHALPGKPDPEPKEWESRLDALEKIAQGKHPGTTIESSTTPPRGKK
jgi:transcriptional regulator with XRE-family HTH domain